MVVTPLTGPAPGGTATLYAHHVAALGTIIAVGAIVAQKLYARMCPIVVCSPPDMALLEHLETLRLVAQKDSASIQRIGSRL